MPLPFGIRIAGLGTYLPGPPLDQEMVRTFLRRYPDRLSPGEQEHLLRATGITTRHYAIDVTDETRRETNTSMAVAAARRALAAARWAAEDVDLLVVTTVVPDQLMPPTSTLVQEALGIERCAELEISANCTAPFKGLAFAASQIQLGFCRRALLCSVQYTSFLCRPPWTTPARMSENQGAFRWIVSDGAAALALTVGQPDVNLRVLFDSTGTGERSGMSLEVGSAFPDLASALASGSQHVFQDDRFVLKVGLPRSLDGLGRMFEALNLDPRSIDHFIPGVSSQRICKRFLEMAEARFALPPTTCRTNLERVGYLGGVGFLTVLDELHRDGRLRPGDTVCAVVEESSKWMFAAVVLRWSP